MKKRKIICGQVLFFYEHLGKWGYTMSDRLETSAETKLYQWTALLLKEYLALEQETAELFKEIFNNQ